MRQRNKYLQKQKLFQEQRQYVKQQKSPIKATNYKLNIETSSSQKNRLLLTHKKQLSNHQAESHRYGRFNSNKLKYLAIGSLNALNFSFTDSFLSKRPKTSKQKVFQSEQELNCNDKKQNYLRICSHTMKFIPKNKDVNPEISFETEAKRLVPEIISPRKFINQRNAKTENGKITRECCHRQAETNAFSSSFETASRNRKTEHKINKGSAINIKKFVVQKSEQEALNRRPNTSYYGNKQKEKKDKYEQFSYEYLEPW